MVGGESEDTGDMYLAHVKKEESGGIYVAHVKKVELGDAGDGGKGEVKETESIINILEDIKSKPSTVKLAVRTYVAGINNLYNKIWSYVKVRPRRFACITAASIGLFAGVISSRSFFPPREIIYDGPLGGVQRVSYEESGKQCFMSINKGNSIHRYFDLEGASKINWMANVEPNYKNDKLERIEIITRKGLEVFIINETEDTTRLSNRIKDLFDKANKDYNNIRKRIRDKKISEYEKRTAELLSHFN